VLGRAKRRLVRLGLPALALATFLAAAAPAQGASPLKIREVFPGSTTYGVNAEYVMLQMTADGQGDIDGQVLRFYNSAGSLASTHTIPSDVANGGSQRTVLLATQEAVDEGLTPSADFNMGSGTDRMGPSGGAVCLTGAGLGAEDCVTWGSIPLFDPLFGGFPDAQTANAGTIADGLALRRKLTGGCATYLDGADDTSNSASDFAQTSPGPRSNSSAPTESRCPPDTALTIFPSNPTNQTSASFTYAAVPSEPGASFKCKLDLEAFATCPSGGKSYPGPLAEGPHTFTVKAVGEGGEDPTPKAFAWTIDAKAPETTIDSAPPEPSGGFEARFTYASSEPSSSYRCQLDGGPVQVCSASGKSYFQLPDGAHVFRVYAVDNAGNQDPTPAERAFTVQGVLIDLTPPDTTVLSAPPDPSPSESASFRYGSTEPGSAFECSLNSSPFAPCPASGVTYSRLRNGSYLFAVRATDAAGNVDSVPAAYPWTVAAPLPTVKIVKSPPGKINLRRGAKASLLFKFKADKPGSVFRCRIDGQRFKPCSATTRLKAKVGRHRFEVYAIDELGNVGTTITRRIVRVQRQTSGGLF